MSTAPGSTVTATTVSYATTTAVSTQVSTQVSTMYSTVVSTATQTLYGTTTEPASTVYGTTTQPASTVTASGPTQTQTATYTTSYVTSYAVTTTQAGKSPISPSHRQDEMEQNALLLLYPIPSASQSSAKERAQRLDDGLVSMGVHC